VAARLVLAEIVGVEINVKSRDALAAELEDIAEAAAGR